MGYDVRFITKRWGHHSTHSGYDQLVGRLGTAIRPLNLDGIRHKWIPGRVAVWLAARSGITLYSQLAFYDEWAAARDLLSRRKPGIYHFLYGDDTFRYFGKTARLRGARVVASYHLPPSALPTYYASFTHLRNLDGLVVVGTNQIPFFAPIVGSDKVFFVPHGVDTRAFAPGDPPRRPAGAAGWCVFVGIHRRDFATLLETIRIAQARDRGVKFTVVTSRDNFGMFEGMGNVDLVHSLPEPELIQLYQNADLLVQPLEDSTANNAILEGMACGLPVVATDIGAVRDYLPEACGALVPPRDAGAMASAIARLLGDDALRGTMAANARRHALQFDWDRIVEKMNQVYAAVA
jgi:glycosyltransferase involved in cell wall biosynthesis